MKLPMAMLATVSLLVLSGCASQIFLDSTPPEPQQVASADAGQSGGPERRQTHVAKEGGDEASGEDAATVDATTIP